ncbi:ABC transporter permease [Paracoccus pantotrophus]|uniref:ABC transporter permease n=1 Tax=Paracoccus pantotrophus TaxID=82367 RepID=UPI0004B985EE|nr:ABC transporter permease [Paracoccus pantotrophus]
MSSFIRKRAFASLVSLLGPVVMVFFLSRLTGDSASLFLPVDATEQMREEFRQLHGFNDPLLTQFGRHVWDPLHLDFGASIRRARPAIDVVLEAFVWTLQPAVITMTLVAVAVAVVVIAVGLLAAFRAGGLFDRIAPLTSLIGASGPDFWVAIVAFVVFSVGLGWLTTSGTGTVWHRILPIAVLFIRPFGLIVQAVRGSMISALSSA